MADITVDGLAGVLATFDKIAEELKKRQGLAAALAANEYKNDVQAKITEIGLYKSGDYRRSVHVEPTIPGTLTDSDGQAYALAGTDNVAARQHEFGGVIKAKNGPYLKFQIDGHWVQVPFVTQPPHPHFYPAFDAGKEKYKQIMAETMLK